MTINYKLRKAEKIIRTLTPDDLIEMNRICNEIRLAEYKLNLAAKKMIQRCYFKCEGICCRNVELDAIIGHWDFIYILTMTPGLRDKISKSLTKEDPLFTSDCMFLDNNTGPCIFPADIRPEKCITTFCFDDTLVNNEIKSVKINFIKLGYFIIFRKPRQFFRFLNQFIKKHLKSVR